MTEESRTQDRRPDLFRMLQEQESEIVRLNGESRKLQNQLEALLLSMDTVSVRPRGIADPAARPSPHPEEEELDAPEEPDDFTVPETAAETEAALQPGRNIVRYVRVKRANVSSLSETAAVESEPRHEEEAPAVEQEEPQINEEEPFWERDSEIQRLHEKNQKLQRQLSDLLTSAKAIGCELPDAEGIGAAPVSAEIAAATQKPPARVALRRAPRRV